MYSKTPREKRVICIPCDLKTHKKIVKNAVKYRDFLDQVIKKAPELFPLEIKEGYLMKDLRYSSKLQLYQRRILIKNKNYTIKPSCIMPHNVGLTDEIEKGLYLRKFNVPYDAFEDKVFFQKTLSSKSYLFGHDAMYWYRLETQFGRYDIVGSTIKENEQLPENILADEKHTRIKGKKAYIATTCAQECVLGVSIANQADEKSLTQAYQVFKDEAQKLYPNYSPKTVNVDGWKATENSLRGKSFFQKLLPRRLKLFPQISIILCFFHVFLGLKQKVTKETKNIFSSISEKLWDCYKAPNKSSFSQKVRRFYEWALKNDIPEIMLDKINKLKTDYFKKVYMHPTAYRTSNLLDRLMVKMDQRLLDTQYFHGSLQQAKLGIRAWALIQNFAPYTPVTIRKYNGWQSPAERLNQHSYHQNWLHNLLVSAHRSERKPPPPKAL